MYKRVRGERGFTLVELLVVLAILAILVAIVVPNLAGITGGARIKAAKEELSIVQTAMDTLMSEKEAMSVTANTTADQVGPNTQVTYWYVSAIDSDGNEVTTSSTATLRLRTTSNGTYTWDTKGKVAQASYPVR